MSAPSRTEVSAGTCLYLLAVVDGGRTLSTMHDGLRLLPVGRVGVVCCEMDPGGLTGLDDDPQDPRLADLARWHDSVVCNLSVEGPVLPMRLGTVVADEDRLAAALAGSDAAFAAALDRVRGCGEWSVHVDADATPPEPQDRAGSDSGAAYLLGRRDALRSADTGRTAATDAAHRLHDALTGCAREAREVPAASEDVLAGRYLVEHARSASFVRALASYEHELVALGCHVHVSGPMPPYSFTDLRVGVAP